MILIHKSPAPPALEALKKEAEKQGLSDKEGYDLLRNPLKKQEPPLPPDTLSWTA